VSRRHRTPPFEELTSIASVNHVAGLNQRMGDRCVLRNWQRWQARWDKTKREGKARVREAGELRTLGWLTRESAFPVTGVCRTAVKKARPQATQTRTWYRSIRVTNTC